jgi:hypothetical protein
MPIDHDTASNKPDVDTNVSDTIQINPFIV